LVDGGRGRKPNVVVLRVASDANDLVGIALILEPDVTSERITAGEVLPRERLIDDDTARLIHVGVAKVASGQEWRAVGEEIVRRHGIEGHTPPVVRRLVESFDPEERAASRA
jgi:hypothetical protein